MYEPNIYPVGKFENLLTMAFDGVGIYDTPQIKPVYDINVNKWIDFGCAKSCKEDRGELGVHFFIDDYRFERVWNKPEQLAKMLKQFKVVMTPDFSTYLDFPEAVRIFNHYRRHWCGAFWQERGMTVIPNIQWGYKDSYSWCFDGDPVGGIVAVSNVGMMRSKDTRERFMDGYKEMLIRLQPKKVLLFGSSFDEYPGPIEYIEYKRVGDKEKWETKREITDYQHRIA